LPAPPLTRRQFRGLVRIAPLPSIDLIVTDRSHRVLLGLRKNQPAKGYWFVPGGRIRKNEHFETAFKRITRQELGVRIPLEDAVPVGLFEHLHRTGPVAGVGTHYVVVALQLVSLPLPDVLPTAQHSRYRWFTLHEAATLRSVHRYTRAYFHKTPATKVLPSLPRRQLAFEPI